MPAPPIVVVGSSNTDLVLRVARLPRPGETVSGGTFATVPGGKGANQAVAASRAGGRVRFVARVGRDAYGAQCIKDLQRDRIDTRFVRTDRSAPSGVALILVDQTGENCIGVAAGANAQLSPADVHRARSAITRAGVVLIQLECPLDTVQSAVELASDAGVPVILNPAPAHPRALPARWLRRISFLTPNETEAESLTGVRVTGIATARKAAQCLLDRGVGGVVITLGARGALVATSDFHEHVPAFPVKPVDTTAAGDVFNGAMAVALAENRSLIESVRFAAAAAALSVTRPGAQPSAPQRDEIEALLGSASPKPKTKRGIAR